MQTLANELVLAAILRYCRDGAGKTKRGQASLLALLSSTIELIREQGYDAVSLRSAARASNLGLRTVQHYFASKEHLLSAIIEYQDAVFELSFQSKLRKPNVSAREIVEDIVDFFIDDNLCEEAKLRNSTLIFLQGGENETIMLELGQTLYLRHLERIKHCLRLVNPDAENQPIQQAAFLIMTLLEGLVGVSYSYYDEPDKTQHQIVIPVKTTIMAWIGAL